MKIPEIPYNTIAMIAKNKEEFLNLTAIEPTGIVMSQKTRNAIGLSDVQMIDGIRILENDDAEFGNAYLVSPMSA